jgi:two-component system phosphate regulon sensor histidine kinase PhoR
MTHVRKLETVRRDFAANVSHELKTPLTAIRGFVETLRNGALHDPQQADRFLKIIESHANRLTALIEDLMNLSEIEQKKHLPKENTLIRKILENAMEMCQMRVGEKKISLEIACPEELEGVVNPSFMELALTNLMDNAVKFSPEGGTVRVLADETENELRIRVEDQGIGISKEHLSRIFERFYRVDTSRSRKLGGTGLGLAIVKHIVRAHQGRVTVDSKIGQGSVFYVHLPK